MSPKKKTRVRLPDDRVLAVRGCHVFSLGVHPLLPPVTQPTRTDVTLLQD